MEIEVLYIQELEDVVLAEVVENFKKRLHSKYKYANIFPVKTNVVHRQTDWRATWRKRQNILF